VLWEYFIYDFIYDFICDFYIVVIVYIQQCRQRCSVKNTNGLSNTSAASTARVPKGSHKDSIASMVAKIGQLRNDELMLICVKTIHETIVPCS
jgi:hypothetical protein